MHVVLVTQCCDVCKGEPVGGGIELQRPFPAPGVCCGSAWEWCISEGGRQVFHLEKGRWAKFALCCNEFQG